jgi:hypothetical protein
MKTQLFMTIFDLIQQSKTYNSEKIKSTNKNVQIAHKSEAIYYQYKR